MLHKLLLANMNISNHPVIKYVKSFTKKDIQMLRKMVSSPYYNNRRFVTDVLYEITKLYPDFESTKLTSKYILTRVSKTKLESSSSFRVALSIINKIITKYLIDKSLENDLYTQKYLLINNHFRNNRVDKIEKEIWELKKYLEDKKPDEPELLYKEYQLTEIESSFRIAHYGKKKNKYDPLLKVLENNIIFLTDYYLYTVLNNFINIFFLTYFHKNKIIVQKIVKVLDELKIELILRVIKKNNEYYFLIELMFFLFLVFKNFNSKKHYLDLKQQLSKNQKYLSNDHKYAFYSAQINYCYIKTKEKNSDTFYLKEFIVACKFYLKEKLYLFGPSKLLDFVLFRMIVDKSLEAGNVMWTHEFIKNNYKSLKEHLQVNGLNYGHTLISIYKGDYLNAMETLIKVDNKSFYFDVRKLKLILFYKLGYISEGINEINSFKKYLELYCRNGISYNIYEDSSLFIRQIRRLYKINFQDKEKVKQYLFLLQKEKSFIHKNLLLKCLS